MHKFNHPPISIFRPQLQPCRRLYRSQCCSLFYGLRLKMSMSIDRSPAQHAIGFCFQRTSTLSNPSRRMPSSENIWWMFFRCHDSLQSVHALHFSGQWMPSVVSSTGAGQYAEVAASRREADIDTRFRPFPTRQGAKLTGWWARSRVDRIRCHVPTGQSPTSSRGPFSQGEMNQDSPVAAAPSCTHGILRSRQEAEE